MIVTIVKQLVVHLSTQDTMKLRVPNGRPDYATSNASMLSFLLDLDRTNCLILSHTPTIHYQLSQAHFRKGNRVYTIVPTLVLRNRNCSQAVR